MADELTGLYYLRARYYNASLGRFTQEDVIYNDGLNLYAYCNSNPVMYSDPSGFAKETCKSKVGGECDSESGLNSNLLDELANSGVKYNPEDIVAITKTADGKLVWLENGTDTAGLNHIITEHADDFLNKGITQEQIPDYVMNALENGKIVGYQGRGTGRPIYEFTYNGEIHKVAITVGNNGFIVGANPK